MKTSKNPFENIKKNIWKNLKSFLDIFKHFDSHVEYDDHNENDNLDDDDVYDNDND